MGEIIRKDAAAEDILDDARTTLAHAQARGGEWQVAAEARLGHVLSLASSVAARLAEARTMSMPAEAMLAVANDVSDRLIHRVADEIWNDVGRPAHDPALDLIFPGGASAYTEGDVIEQPDRMSLLADLIEASIHPRLSDADASRHASAIRADARALNDKVESVRPLRVRIAIASKMHQTIARNAQLALSGLKRAWKADGKSEVEIHEVIPDRPTGNKKVNPAL